MSLSPADWHARFLQQAQWTQGIRDHLYRRAKIERAQRVLDVGSGTGALFDELIRFAPPAVFGLDIHAGFLAFAQKEYPQVDLVRGDAFFLPYASGSFDVCLCHFLLLWIARPEQVIQEMRRVTRPGGCVFALAEPDYGGRIDYPAALSRLGEVQRTALKNQGADPETGRRLASIFSRAGFQWIETGVLGGQWVATQPVDEEAFRLEWLVLEDDLAGSVSKEQQNRWRELDREARMRGERILYVPTFYAYGIVPGGK